MDDKIMKLATEIRCGPSLARDFLVLAGDDADLVREASAKCHGVESVKAYIIGERMTRIERKGE